MIGWTLWLSQSFFLFRNVLIFVCVSVCVDATGMWDPWRSGKDIGSSGVGVTGVCEQVNIGDGN